jgi:predicted nucleic acid-binding protein
MTQRFVVDASVVAGWVLTTQATPYASSVMRLLRQGSLCEAPDLLHWECVNILLTQMRRGRLTQQQAEEALRLIADVRIRYEDHFTTENRLLSLGARYGLTCYDAMYLALALQQSLPVASTDAALCLAAEKAGVGVVAF